MDYKKFVQTMKGEPRDEVSAGLWSRIEQTLEEQQQRRPSWKMFSLIPSVALAGVVVTIAAVFLMDYSYRTDMGTYIQRYGSTEYIYDGYRYTN